MHTLQNQFEKFKGKPTCLPSCFPPFLPASSSQGAEMIVCNLANEVHARSSEIIPCSQLTGLKFFQAGCFRNTKKYQMKKKNDVGGYICNKHDS